MPANVRLSLVAPQESPEYKLSAHVRYDHRKNSSPGMARRLFQNYPCLLINIFLAFLSYHCSVASLFFNKCVAYSTLSYISVLVAMIWSLQDIQLVRF